MERRLSAIMAADVVGYSRLMGANEVGTLTALKEHRAQLVDPTIAEHQGRIVKLTGDGMLVEFPSVVSAVECAAEVQHEMRSRNVEVPEDRRIEFRIGINLGDVIVDDDDIFGEGVNVAARLESIAKPGGVAVSSAVRENIGNKLDLVFEDMGDVDLKNIGHPVRVFNVALGNAPVRAKTKVEEADKPSIAVLPFNNMSGDTEQEYFSDGMTEDIITDLSKVSGLFVVGRNTSFTYKGKAQQLQQVAAELGVKYLLEGSVRKSGNRVRVTGQLIDGTTGGHVWADRYDRDLDDIFAIQDEITQAIVGQLRIHLLPQEKEAITTAPTGSVEAYNFYLKGRQLFHAFTRSYLLLAKEMFGKAVEIDPDYGRAYAGMASAMSRLWGMYNVPTDADELLAIADKALALDPNLAEVHSARGEALANSGRREEAVQAFQRALELDPNNFDANLAYARFSVTEGDLDKAIELYTRAVEIQPEDSQAPLLLQIVLRAVGRSEESDKYGWMGIKRAEEQLKLHPENSRPAQLGSGALATLGDKERALKWLERVKLIDPDDNNARYNAACTYAQLGEIDHAMDLLELWIDHCGAEQERWFLHDSDLDPIRKHPRYQSLLDRFKQRHATEIPGPEVSAT
ncbi:TPR end-of-group domain-containing protein [Sphingomonas alba]|uniref:Tetratricopeptide repeat protein n=1 Tax=Sphingomonas alba TaxID=2908208 RepID=A0ABT0RM10_9SPHN|nr:tetratricopeptide repeat protein [Sphingomonas alba]MCL6683679.1 tetratricopeptide repeat protein [Sphingomonas alba]